ncbi:Protein phosphatase 2C (PP2C)-like domain [Pseudocohnilembus persalinus]|uniref:Protein phosphatase n=1 Tax=Pseudocohnilembus persalinus TaxID=266149 RepID=A0A0V0QI71_PSEPJ|nr:Protein phosphatase 2C (PP2C)-like domain [Pseudocohnilembus persalinus]|eukprot:KRX01894.1 Protein phosphatase 2C (PP2C)-like domain [Pseudocohnilembus persalinus]
MIRHIFILLTILFLFIINSNQYNYSENGDDWTDGVCSSGTSQSPIEITFSSLKCNSDRKITLASNNQDYTVTPIVPDGTETNLSLQFDLENYGNLIIKDNSNENEYIYQGTSIIIHSPSEHVYNGNKYDVELQIYFDISSISDSDVTQTLIDNGITSKSVISLIFYVYDSSSIADTNSVFSSERLDISDLSGDITINPSKIFSIYDFSNQFYYYQGSLTTPDCTEDVNWYLMGKAIPISQENFDIIANYYSDAEEITKNYNHFLFSSGFRPHDDKVQTGGEDAFLISDQIMAVADGVGGWNRYGVDPAFFSRELCKNLETNFNSNKTYYTNHLVQLIQKSHQKVKYTGSSTLVVASIQDDKPILNTALLGDSGYILFRVEENKLNIIYEFSEQQHSFNFPYQLSYSRGPNAQSDKASDSILMSHEVQDGDIIVMGSDGLFDNLYLDQISNIANYKSPFTMRGLQQGFNIQHQGKQDDITVLVGVIKLSDNLKKQIENESKQFAQNEKIDL